MAQHHQHERTSDRTDLGNDFKPKTVMTRLGERTFDLPHVLGSGFYPSTLDKGFRTEQARNLALTEIGVESVSVRDICDILDKLLGSQVSTS